MCLGPKMPFMFCLSSLTNLQHWRCFLVLLLSFENCCHTFGIQPKAAVVKQLKCEVVSGKLVKQTVYVLPTTKDGYEFSKVRAVGNTIERRLSG